MVNFSESDSASDVPEKKKKVAKYELTSPQKELMKKDKNNKKLWDEAKESTTEGGQVWSQKILTRHKKALSHDMRYRSKYRTTLFT